MREIHLVATDLDGTFLRDDKTISKANLNALQDLRNRGVVTVAATGRNLFKIHEVIPKEVPFDYYVFSSGAGVFDKHKEKHIFGQNLPKESALKLIRYFMDEDLNFHAFWPVPNNHKLWYYRGSEICHEFERYFAFHNSRSFELPADGKIDSDVCQFLVVIPYDEARFMIMKSNIEQLCPMARVIRSSSPLHTNYIWLEIFHKDVSKGNGVLHLCNMLGIDPQQTLGIGNDYNDIDLLEFTAHAFITNNAPEVIKKQYVLVPSNEEDAFAHVIEKFVQS